jgi:cyanophycinase
MLTRSLSPFVLVVLTVSVAIASDQPVYKYQRLGNAKDVQTTTTAGTMLIGGGKDIDAAFQWMCARSRGGDFLVLRATGDDAYNPYIRDLCHPNSVATLVIPSRDAANDRFVAETIRHAEAIFISGGDQANYINFWSGTPVQQALNDQIARGVPIGGTSAGLAVLGQFAFGALNDTAYSSVVLADPYDKTVTVVRDFLKVPHMEGIITDTHFAKRDRLGRLLVFMARIIQDGWAPRIRAIGVDERAAVSLDVDGNATVLGTGAAYFLESTQPPIVCQSGTPLNFQRVSAYKVPVGASFSLTKWDGTGGASYELSAQGGKVHTTSSSRSPY